MNRNIKSRVGMTLALLVMPLLALLAFQAQPAAAQTNTTTATANLIDSTGKAVGTANFTQTASGVRIQIGVNGGVAMAVAGEHGIHVHQTGVCDAPDFESSGEHFNPLAKDHGMDNEFGPHAGDLPNITLDATGAGTYDTTTTMITLSPGELSVFDTDGSSIMIHANPDDYMTGPSGKSGGRIICGIIVASATGTAPGMPTTGAGNSLPLLPLALLGLTLAAGGFYMVRSRAAKI